MHINIPYEYTCRNPSKILANRINYLWEGLCVKTRVYFWNVKVCFSTSTALISQLFSVNFLMHNKSGGLYKEFPHTPPHKSFIQYRFSSTDQVSNRSWRLSQIHFTCNAFVQPQLQHTCCCCKNRSPPLSGSSFPCECLMLESLTWSSSPSQPSCIWTTSLMCCLCSSLEERLFPLPSDGLLFFFFLSILVYLLTYFWLYWVFICWSWTFL